MTDDFELNFCVGDGDKTVLKFDKNSYQFIFKRSDSKYGIEALKNYLYNIPISQSSCQNNILKSNSNIISKVKNIHIQQEVKQNGKSFARNKEKNKT